MKRGISFLLILLILFMSGCSKGIGIKDTAPPVIKYASHHEFTYNYGTGEPDWLEDVLILDNVDGIITDSIKIDTSHFNLQKLGTYPIYYTLKDKAGNEIKVKRTVIVKDIESPNLSGFSDIILPLDSTEPDYLDPVKSIDNYDGNISSRITVDTSHINYEKIGEYPLYYHIEDTTGNKTTVKVSVFITDQERIIPDSPLGMPVNMVTSTPYDYKIGQSIFDENFVNAQKRMELPASSSDSESIVSYHKGENRISSMDEDFNIRDERYSFLKKTIKNFDQTYDIDLYETQYFHLHTFQYQKYGEVLENSLGDKASYIDHLKPEYLSDLEKLSKDQLTYEQFFTKYGTHYIIKVYFGGQAQMFYSVLSNQDKTRSEMENNEFTDISVGISSLGGTSTSITESDDLTYFAISLSGGTGFSFDPENKFIDQFQNWISSLDEEGNYRLVAFGQGGLVPLWKALPNDYLSLQEPMEAAYNAYKLLYKE